MHNHCTCLLAIIGSIIFSNAIQGSSPRIVNFDSTWRYLHTGPNPPADWHSSDFVDTNWLQGPGPLGYEQDIIPIPVRTSFPLSSRITYYFRTDFVFEGVPSNYYLRLETFIDDGAVIYLNGIEKLRIGMYPGAINADVPAERAVVNVVQEVFTVPSDGLREGTNTLAVEVHQTSASSPDLVLGLALEAHLIAPSRLAIVSEPDDLVVASPTPVVLDAEISGARGEYQWFKNGDPIAGANRSTLLIDPSRPDDTGTYYLTASNTVNTVRTRDIAVRVDPDTNSPVLIQADGTLGSHLILLEFSESVANSATNPANYSVTNTTGGIVAVHTVSQIAPNLVRLETDPRLEGNNYVVIANGVSDLASPANIIETDSLAAVVSEQVLIPFDAYWHFYSPFSGFDPPHPGNDWLDENHDLSHWSFGQAGFYSGSIESPIAINTVLSSPRATAFFRISKQVGMSPAGRTFHIHYVVDDGAIFYVNGRQAHRARMPTQGTDHGLVADESPYPTAENAELESALFVTGTNVIAAQVHSSAVNDQAALFGAELTVRFKSLAHGPVIIIRQPGPLSALENMSAQLDFEVVGASDFQWFLDNAPIEGATGPTLTLESITADLDGALLHVQAWNEEDSVSSVPAPIYVIPDLTPPALLRAVTEGETVVAWFSERLSASSTTNATLFRVFSPTGRELPVVQVEPASSNRVIITTASPVPGGFSLWVQGVQDASSAGNESPLSGVVIGWDGVTLPFESVWRFNEQNIDPGPNWILPDYNDSAWAAGPGPFGTDSAASPVPFRTPLTAPGQGGPITAYFRVWFEYSGPTNAAVVDMHYMVDDGAVFYLNGVEAHRVRVSPGQTHTSFSSETVGDATLEGPLRFPVGAIRLGLNLLAVELHQGTGNSSDAVLGVALLSDPISSVLVQPPSELPSLKIRTEPNGAVTVIWSGDGVLLQRAPRVTGPWSNVPLQPKPFTVPPNQVRLVNFYFRLIPSF